MWCQPGGTCIPTCGIATRTLCRAGAGPAEPDVTMDTMPRSDRATFRLPAVALFVPALLFFCIAPLATAGGWWALLFVVPVAALAWVLITRTTATEDRMTAHGLLGSRRMSWTDLDQLEFTDSRWAIAVAQDGRRLRLPMVRPRDLPRLTAVAGGTLRLGEDAPPPGDPATEVGVEENPADPAAEPAGQAVADPEPDGVAQPAEPAR
jgi:Bacterial PH domain